MSALQQYTWLQIATCASHLQPDISRHATIDRTTILNVGYAYFFLVVCLAAGFVADLLFFVAGLLFTVAFLLFTVATLFAIPYPSI